MIDLKSDAEIVQKVFDPIEVFNFGICPKGEKKSLKYEEIVQIYQDRLDSYLNDKSENF